MIYACIYIYITAQLSEIELGKKPKYFTFKMTGLRFFFFQNAALIVRQTFSVKLRGIKISAKSLILSLRSSLFSAISP